MLPQARIAFAQVLYNMDAYCPICFWYKVYYSQEVLHAVES
jgi:hypothetical protein